jgi:hypothetical protein
VLGSASPINLNATTGVSRPFTNCAGSATVVTGSRSALNVPSDKTVSPAAANCCSLCDMLTVSPTRVYSRRSSDPRRAAAAREALAFPLRIDGVLLGVHAEGSGNSPIGVVVLSERRAEHGHDGIADELHDRPILPENRIVHSGPMDVELPGQLAGVRVLRDGRIRPDVAHEYRHRHAFRLTDVPPITPKLLRQAARKQAGQRLPLFFPIHYGLVEKAEALERALGPRRHPLGQLYEHRLHFGIDG